jgi:hypothetical protein
MKVRTNKSLKMAGIKNHDIYEVNFPVSSVPTMGSSYVLDVLEDYKRHFSLKDLV